MSHNLSTAIPSLLKTQPGSRSAFLGQVIMRRGPARTENPRPDSRRGAGFYAFEVGVSGITTEEYLATLSELWRRRPQWNQKEATPEPFKHLRWDLKYKHVRLVKYNSSSVGEARGKNGLPPLDAPAPKGYALVNEDLLERILSRF